MIERECAQVRGDRFGYGFLGVVLAVWVGCGVSDVSPPPSALESDSEGRAELPPLTPAGQVARPSIALEDLAPMQPPRLALESLRVPGAGATLAPDLEERVRPAPKAAGPAATR